MKSPERCLVGYLLLVGIVTVVFLLVDAPFSIGELVLIIGGICIGLLIALYCESRYDEAEE